MRSSWPRKDEMRDPRSWELYHENAKRGRRLGVADATLDGPASPGDSSWTGREPACVRPESDADSFDLEAGRCPSGPPREGALTVSSLATALSGVDRIADDFRYLEILLYINAVDALPLGLYHYAPGPRSLIHLGQAHPGREMMAALGESRSAPAYVFVIGALENVAEIAGERGYRQALVATGRTMLALETASESAGIGCRAIERFYDREVDRLLRLDGLSCSVLGVLALERDPGP